MFASMDSIVPAIIFQQVCDYKLKSVADINMPHKNLA